MSEIIINSTYTDRIDKILCKYFPDKTRNFWQKKIKKGCVFINDKKIFKNNILININDIIKVLDISEDKQHIPATFIPLKTIYEDKYLLVLNKQRGLVVHPGNGHFEDTLVNALIYKYGNENLSSISKDGFRPGIVHRLDKDTSGLMIIAKEDKVHSMLANYLKEKKITRKYLTLVHGENHPNRFIVERPIRRSQHNKLKMEIHSLGKYSKTFFSLKNRYRNYSLYECILSTGRTHQIRVHLSSVGIQIVGDEIYNKKNIKNEFLLKGQFLHSYYLEFIHPISRKKMKFNCDLPPELKKIVQYIERSKG